jgi:hypothetical protein
MHDHFVCRPEAVTSTLRLRGQLLRHTGRGGRGACLCYLTYKQQWNIRVSLVQAIDQPSNWGMARAYT